MKTESDGIFEYFYMVNQGYDKNPAQDYYVIVSSFSELDKITYIPAYYNNKPVRAVYCEFFHGWYYPTEYGLDFFGAETIYFPFCCELEYKSRNFPLISFFANNSLPYSKIYDWGANLPNGGMIYLTSGLYNKYNEFTMNNLRDSAYNSIDDAHSIYEYSSEKICYLIRANTAYLFNYEGAPNEGYFFINDFEYGDKIEDTPYKPMREGYTFNGWYKEAECNNEWNFDEDRLPQETYDENGELNFVETKLYAKWIKN
jgi:uncharacterized repeat protein (TIGR02543 family)